MNAAGLRALLREHGDPGTKQYHTGTHRVCAPDVTLARVRPLMPEMGITRLANITGLDSLGIPVVMACRPNSRSVAVSQGKGLTLEAAKASALMEAVESYHAETCELPQTPACYGELARDGAVVDVHRLPWCVDSDFHDELPRMWVQGRDLVSGALLHVPFELVHTDYTLPGPEPHRCFSATTNGLASGNHALEAIAHALCETIERDATTLWQLRLDDARRATVIDPQSVDDPLCRTLLERLAAGGIDTVIWDATSDVGVAAFYCVIVDRTAEGSVPEFGAGCHPTRGVALARALSEAAQARTTYIAGSRDDFDPDWYAEDAKLRRRETGRLLVERHRPARRFEEVPDFRADTVQEDIRWLLCRLAAVGIEQVVAVDLGKPRWGIPVFRVIVPDLEGPYRGARSDYVPGSRALRLLDPASHLGDTR